jgi:hypothetical protein
MFKKIVIEIGKIFISPVPYILALALGGAFFVCYGVFLLLGQGAAALTLGVLMLVCMVAISRSVSGG